MTGPTPQKVCADGQHNFAAPVIVKQKILWGALYHEVAICFCLRCGVVVSAGWQE